MATSGKDGAVRLWDMNTAVASASGAAAPKLVSRRRFALGQCFSIQFHPNSPDVIGACGAAGKPLVYTITSDLQTGGSDEAPDGARKKSKAYMGSNKKKGDAKTKGKGRR
jgi:hypothetical protein